MNNLESSIITGIYPGTFDPVTFGHLDIIVRATHIVNKLIVSVAENTHKKPFFSINERIDMIKDSLKKINSNDCLIEVVGFDNLLVEHAKSSNAKVIIRGLRIGNDFEYERGMALINREINNGIETVCLISAMPNQFISSSRVKEIALLGGDYKKFIPEKIYEFSKTKLMEA